MHVSVSGGDAGYCVIHMCQEMRQPNCSPETVCNMEYYQAISQMSILGERSAEVA